MINYGVIVGRFQVHQLHPGHISLFDQVAAKHQRVIVFIGVQRTVPTKRNPMDFETRKKMIQAQYPEFTVLPLRDEKHDQYWSEKLDEKIEDVTQFTGSITLYGGRDSFLPHYFGKHVVTELEIANNISGTDVRDMLSNQIMGSADFRAGTIYAAQNQFPRTVPTVDIAILYRRSDNGIKICFGRKSGEKLLRFVGGFAERNESYESSAKREAYEETNLSVSGLEYVGSYPIKDWRYCNDTDAGIVTAFYVGWADSQGGRASDDIEQIAWVNFEDLPSNDGVDFVEPGHVQLLSELKRFILRRYYHAA